jgi:hypothetical protein
VDIQTQASSTSSLVADKWPASRLGRHTPGEISPGTRWIVGWVDNRAGLDDVKKTEFLTLPGLELRPLGRPARSQSLYRLRYPPSKTVPVLSEASRNENTSRNGVRAPQSFASELDRSMWSASCFCRFTLGEKHPAPTTHWPPHLQLVIDWIPEPLWTIWKSLDLTGTRHLTPR